MVLVLSVLFAYGGAMILVLSVLFAYGGALVLVLSVLFAYGGAMVLVLGVRTVFLKNGSLGFCKPPVSLHQKSW